MKTAELLHEPVRLENDARRRRVSIPSIEPPTPRVRMLPTLPQEHEDDPFHLGYRVVKGLYVPLSAYDVRHPIEDDFIVTSY